MWQRTTTAPIVFSHAVLSVTLAILLALVSGRLASSAGAQAAPTPPLPPSTVDASQFVTVVDNPYFPLIPGTTFVYDGSTEDGPEHVEVTVTFETKTILGVTCTVVRDQVSVAGEVVEDTLDWFAQDNDGNVWYFGEASADYEDGVVISTDGSWEAGVGGAVPGIIMPGRPIPGDPYYQEYAAGTAEDIGQVIAIDETVTTASGTYDDVIVTEETNPLDPGPVEHKYYAPGIGLVLEEDIVGDQGRIELTEIRIEIPATPVTGDVG